MLELVLTREDANSDSALLVEWLVADRERVRKGQPVCVVETTKSALELEAPGEGILCRLAAEGEDVPLGSRIAVVAASEDELAELDALTEPPPVAAPRTGPAKATRKAVELAAAHGIDLDAIEKTGFITVEDVQAAIDGRSGGEERTLAGISVARVSLPAVLELDEGAGALDQDFLRRLREDGASVRALPEDERLALYRAHGAQVGEDVRLGSGTLLVAPRIVLGDGVEFGDGCTVSCDEVVAIGGGTAFRPRLRLQCRRVFIGEGGYFGEDVQIGGGGSRDPQALFVVGDLVYVGAEAYLNPCRPILIGREVFVTMRSMLVTHNIGHSLLEGFENRFAPIVLEDRCQIGLGAVVYAGCRIGAEAILVSNSYAVSDVPPGKLAAGVPAKAAGNVRRELSNAQRVELAERMLAELYELLEQRGHEVAAPPERPLRRFTVDDSQVLFVEGLDRTFETPPAAGETVVLTLGLDGEPPEGCAVLDLLGRRVHAAATGTVLDSVREFCRKRGIRFEPGPWRYGGGLV